MTNRIWTFGADVDTDQIVPGRYAPFMLKEGQDVGDFAFVEANPEFCKDAVAGDIIVADDNFGCGSSREYAPLALKRRKIGGIVANSFSRIFFRNAINLGIPVYAAPEVVAELKEGDQAVLDTQNDTLTVGETVYDLPALPDFAREIMEAGGVVPYVREHGRFPGEADA